jgi:hypothetical protein
VRTRCSGCCQADACIDKSITNGLDLQRHSESISTVEVHNAQALIAVTLVNTCLCCKATDMSHHASPNHDVSTNSA